MNTENGKLSNVLKHVSLVSIPLLVIVSLLRMKDLGPLRDQVITLELVTMISCFSLTFVLGTLYFMTPRPKKVYMVDFACYKPGPELACSKKRFIELITQTEKFSEGNLAFMQKILERSGLGDKTYLPEALLQTSEPAKLTMSDARKEAEMIMFGAIDELLGKTGVKVKEIGILVVNCTMFCSSPSLSSMIINHYKLREDILSYNLGGMGCSASIISIDLAKDLLQVHPNSYALVISLDVLSLSMYTGTNRSMLVSNCLFRTGGAAMLLSNKPSDHSRSKYQLIHTVRTHKGADDRSYSCAILKEDEKNIVGAYLSKELMAVAGEALKGNITTLRKLVCPVSDKLLNFATLAVRKMVQMKMIKPYIRDFKLDVEHICIHAGGKAVLDAMEKSLNLNEWQMEPSRMTLYRFGNTTSSSLWYELAYSEAKGRIRKGDRALLIALGAGFKCNSAVWIALKNIDPAIEKNVWKEYSCHHWQPLFNLNSRSLTYISHATSSYPCSNKLVNCGHFCCTLYY